MKIIYMSTENDIRQKSEINPKNKEIYLSAPNKIYIFLVFLSYFCLFKSC